MNSEETSFFCVEAPKSLKPDKIYHYLMASNNLV